MAERNGRSSRKGGGVLDGAPTEQLTEEFQHLMSALADKVLSSATDRVGGLTDKLAGLGENGGSAGAKAVGKAGEKAADGKSPLVAGLAAGAEGIKSKVSEAFGGGGGGKGGKKLKVTNIIEEIDIGAPVDVVYNQWTQFQDFSNFMKKVDGVDQKEEQKLAFKAQVLWSHRTWEATIIDQVPDERIVWRSKGEKGHVDGAVTFHELGPNLTRVLVVLEYHPQGLFERTGNLWRAQGRRARLELKHFRRHVMTHAMLHPDEVEGWRGEIHDSKVTKSPEDFEAEHEDEDEDESDDAEDEYEDEDDDEAEDADDDDAEDEYEDEDGSDDAEDEYEDEDDDEAEDADDDDAEDEYEDEDDDEAEDADDDDAEDEYDEDDDDEDPAERPRSRGRARSGRR
jgi:uncharacterized membrane protein